MLRLGFTGFIETDYFYELANNFGLLIWLEIPISQDNCLSGEEEDPGNRKLSIENHIWLYIQHLLQHPSLAIITWKCGEKRWFLNLTLHSSVFSLSEKEFSRSFGNILNEEKAEWRKVVDNDSCFRNSFLNVTNPGNNRELYCGSGKY